MRLVWRTALIITREGQRKQQIATFPLLFLLFDQQLLFSIHAVYVKVCARIDTHLTHAYSTHTDAAHTHTK